MLRFSFNESISKRNAQKYINLVQQKSKDAQISSLFQEGSRLEGLSIIIQGYNLTDEPLFATQGDQDGRLVQDYQRWGAQYSVGFSYKF